MDIVELKASIRNTRGNSPARALRREGQFPAVLYGPQRSSTLLAVNAKEFENILKSRKSNHMPFRLTVENGEQIGCTVLLKEIQIHPISRKYLHADFYEVPANRKVKVKVPVVAKGLAKGVELGGMIQIIRRELVVICYPQDIPEAIEIDVTNLGIGEAVHIKELSFEGLEFPADANVTVITLLGKEKGKEGSERAEGSEEAESAPSKK